MEMEMERDFMGLAAAVKHETSDDPIDAVPLRSSAMHWPFPSKGSAAVPQLLSFGGAQGEVQKTGFDSLTSTGLVCLTTTAQKNIGHEKQGGVRYATNHSINRAVTNQMNLTILPTSGSNLIGSLSLAPHPAVGVPFVNPMPSSPVVGTTDLRNASKVSGGPSQLTIFYDGSVCVYDNISPEKAQAIMLLAGNGPAMTPAQTPLPRSPVLDAFVVSQPYGGPMPHNSTPASVNAVSVPQYGARKAVASNDVVSVKLGGGIALLSEPQTVVGPLVGSVSPPLFSTATVPQFRRKSLAQFLEKRKERLTSASPYAEKISADCSTPGLSTNSSGSCPVPAMN